MSIIRNRRGLLADRPNGARSVGDDYFATDLGIEYEWNGAAWLEVGSTHTGAFAPDDHNLVSWVYDPVIINESALMTNGQLHLIKLPIREATTVSTLYWYVETVATTPVADQNRVGLYSSAGDRLADVVVNSVLSSTGLKSTSLGSVAVSAGFVWAAFLFNASTPPRLGRGAVLSNIHEVGAVGLTPATGRFAINGTGQTTLPATRTPASNNIGAGNFPGPWCALGA